MRTSRVLLLILTLASQPFWAFGHDWVGGVKDPIAEKLYRKELVTQLGPVAVVAMILLMVWAFRVAGRKAKQRASQDANSYEI
jgi:hypothetical protein